MKPMQKILNFLSSLKENNHREWMQENQKIYKEARGHFEHLVGEILMDLSLTDESLSGIQVKDCIFRLHRDVRFSKDKSPYKTNMAAVISKGGKKAVYALHYLHIEPGNASMLAGGMYMPPNDILKKVREEIDYNPDEFSSILSEPDFIKYFGHLEGDKLKRPPKGYAPEDPNIEWLKHKSYLAIHPVPDKALLMDNFAEYVSEVFKSMRPFNTFLNRIFD
ncbi:MAG: DUF2461 domain-containing protein [Cyclobacteriaceae bacterium]|nr:DUF2461 domain-containing protein [Cyclobacteriaceae bacterium]